MPPRKKGNDKSKEQPPPSSAPPPEVEEEKDNVDVEEKISEFNMASSVAVDTFGNFIGDIFGTKFGRNDSNLCTFCGLSRLGF